MSKIKNLVFSALLTIGAFGAVTFTACNTDECKDVVCNNGGACISGTCSCTSGYEGNNCETQSRAKFQKNWNVNETPRIANPYTCLIAAGTNIRDVAIASTFANSFFNNPITGTVDGNTLTIPVQKPDVNGNYNVQGTLTFANGQLSSSYTITNTLTASTIVVTGTWQ